MRPTAFFVDMEDIINIPIENKFFLKGIFGEASVLRLYQYLIQCLIIIMVPGTVCGQFASVVSDPGAYIKFAEQIATTAEQTLELRAQLEQLKLQLKNQKLMTEGFQSQEWDDFTDMFMQLDEIADQGEAISYTMADYDSQFKKMYPGYHAPEHYSSEYQAWNRSTMDSVRNALSAAGLQHNEFKTESAKLRTLARLSESAKGQTQAIQAGNMIASHMINQMQKLRQLQMTQMQAQNAYMAYELNKDGAKQNALDSMIQGYKITNHNLSR